MSPADRPDLLVRPYEARDRSRVRHICHETGYLGAPVAWLWRDVESFADMFSGYYTDEEPGSAWVVEVDGVVSGYLLGAVDARKAWDPAAVAGRHVVRRGIALRPGTAGAIWQTVLDGAIDVARKRIDPKAMGFHDRAYPAHLHIDLLPEARGAGAGRRLVSLWFERLAALGVPGCHLETFAENTGAIAFFESLGFERVGPAMLIPGFRRRGAPRMHTQAMARVVPPATV